MKIIIRKRAIKDLGKIDQKNKEKIHSKILELREYRNVSNIKKLTNLNQHIDLRWAIIEYCLIFPNLPLKLVGFSIVGTAINKSYKFPRNFIIQLYWIKLLTFINEYEQV